MKSHIKNILAALSGLTLAAMLMVGVANAQGSPAPKESPDSTKSADTKATDPRSIQNVSTNAKNSTDSKATSTKPTKKPAETTPTSATVGEDAGSYTVVSTIEVGARGQRVGGDTNKFRSDLNYHAGQALYGLMLSQRLRPALPIEMFM